MSYYLKVGQLPRHRHTLMPKEGGGYHEEELMGEEGFSHASSLLYHRHLPAAIVAAETIQVETPDFRPNQPLLPRHFKPTELPGGGDPIGGRRWLLGNDQVWMGWSSATEDSGLYRNAIGDELIYVYAGTGCIRSIFGSLDIGPGDYVHLPTGTTYRIEVGADEPLQTMTFAAGHTGRIEFPSRYLGRNGQLLEHAPFCERDLRVPEGPWTEEGTDVEVVVRQVTGFTRYTLANHPFDVVGWDGCLYPYVFNIKDFAPIVGGLHQPPPVHQTFAGPGFVICSFCPRPFDFWPGAIKVPYSHANLDSDEVLFYTEGNFMSRAGSGIGQGSISLHPAGHIHGPQPGSLEGALGAERTEEYAVMLDTFKPLGINSHAFSVEDPNYAWTWSKRHLDRAGETTTGRGPGDELSSPQ